MNNNEQLKVRGFRFAGVSAGLKKGGDLDLGLIVSDTPAVCAGVFTTNKVVAAPVQLTLPRIRNGKCQAILVNSKNANACTGPQGFEDAVACSSALAAAMNIDDEVVAVSSTGVIGQRLDVGKIEAAIPGLVSQLKEGSVADVADAMMTTDSFSKVSAAYGEAGGSDYTILGVAKGAGMIHPNMATMLAFVVTDAALPADFLDAALRQATENSFNRITVDRDTSTNDMVLLLANGAGSAEISGQGEAAETFVSLLQEVLLDLAKMIVSDGEGATKLVRIQVEGAASDEDALLAAETVATSNLVKTAFFGEDANWGRIIAAAGRAGVPLDPGKIDIFFNDVCMVKNGVGCGEQAEARATDILKTDEFAVCIDLDAGNSRTSVWTCDFSIDYVKINADYRS